MPAYFDAQGRVYRWEPGVCTCPARLRHLWDCPAVHPWATTPTLGNNQVTHREIMARRAQLHPEDPRYSRG